MVDFTNKAKYFIDTDSVIYRVWSEQDHNFPGRLHVSYDTVSILDDDDCEIESYTLWNSLSELATAIES